MRHPPILLTTADSAVTESFWGAYKSSCATAVGSTPEADTVPRARASIVVEISRSSKGCKGCGNPRVACSRDFVLEAYPAEHRAALVRFWPMGFVAAHAFCGANRAWAAALSHLDPAGAMER